MKHNYKNLSIWSDAIDLSIEIYNATKNFPLDERFGLTSQIRKAGVSIPSNIAEGAGRNTNNDFGHFLGISIGSTCEVITQLIIARRLNYINEKQFDELMDKAESVQRRAASLQNSLKAKGV